MSPDLRRVLGIQALALLAALLCIVHEQAHAQSSSRQAWSALEQRCWQQHAAERTAVDLRDPTALPFSNLRSGFRVRSPVWVEFSVRGMGLMPAGHFAFMRRKAGSPIQSQTLDDGRTDAYLDLPRGDHEMELRLLGNDGQTPIPPQVLRLSVQRP